MNVPRIILLPINFTRQIDEDWIPVPMAVGYYFWGVLFTHGNVTLCIVKKYLE